jgi:hypothetical protein
VRLLVRHRSSRGLKASGRPEGVWLRPGVSRPAICCEARRSVLGLRLEDGDDLMRTRIEDDDLAADNDVIDTIPPLRGWPVLAKALSTMLAA